MDETVAMEPLEKAIHYYTVSILMPEAKKGKVTFILDLRSYNLEIKSQINGLKWKKKLPRFKQITDDINKFSTEDE